EWQHVLRDHAIPADHGVTAYAAKLVHSAECADHRPVFYGHMPGKCHGIGKNRMVPDPRIMGDMDVDHQEIIVADARYKTPALGAPLYRDELTDLITVTDARLGPLSLVFQILRSDANR